MHQLFTLCFIKTAFFSVLTFSPSLYADRSSGNFPYTTYKPEYPHWQKDTYVTPERSMKFSEYHKGAKKDISELKEYLNEQLAASPKKITLPPGIYHSKGSMRGIHWKLEELKNVEIEAEGVHIICHSPSRALSLENCKNVTIKNLIIDYDPEALPFTQGTLLSIKGSEAKIRIHKGYPLPGSTLKTIRKISVYNPLTLLLMENIWTNYQVPFSIEGDVVTLMNFRKPNGIVPGDYISFVHNQGIPHGITLSDCTGVTLENISLHSAPMFAVLSGEGKNNVFRGIRITPGPIPDNGTVPRLKSGAQDGIHLKDTTSPLIENCLIDSHSDDGIAINSGYTLIVKTEGNTAYITSKNGKNNLAAGDKVRYTLFSNMEIAGNHTINSYEKVKDKTLIDSLDEMKMKMPLSSFLKNSALKRKAFWKVTWESVDGSPPLKAGNFWSSLTANKGAVIRGNIIRNHRARALMLKTSNCLIENNTIIHSQMAGIVFSPERYWMEADFGRNITIRNNKFFNCGYASPNTASDTAAVINFLGMGDHGAFAPAGQHDKIIIENNTIKGAFKMPFLFVAVSNLKVKNNKIDHSHFFKDFTGKRAGISQEAMAWLKNCKNVLFKGNSYTNSGEYFKGKKYISKDVKNGKFD